MLDHVSRRNYDLTNESFVVSSELALAPECRIKFSTATKDCKLDFETLAQPLQQGGGGDTGVYSVFKRQLTEEQKASKTVNDAKRKAALSEEQKSSGKVSSAERKAALSEEQKAAAKATRKVNDAKRKAALSEEQKSSAKVSDARKKAALRASTSPNTRAGENTRATTLKNIKRASMSPRTQIKSTVHGTEKRSGLRSRNSDAAEKAKDRIKLLAEELRIRNSDVERLSFPALLCFDTCVV